MVDYRGQRLAAYRPVAGDTVDLIDPSRSAGLVFVRLTCRACTDNVEALAVVLEALPVELKAIVMLDRFQEPEPYSEIVADRVAGLLAFPRDMAEIEGLQIRYVPTLAVFEDGQLVYGWAGVPGRLQVRQARRELSGRSRVLQFPIWDPER